MRLRARNLATSWVVLSLAAFPLSSKGASFKLSEELKKKIPLDGATKLYIKNARGSTKIVGKADLEYILLRAVKKTKAKDEEEARTLLKLLSFKVKKRDETISVITHHPDWPGKKKSFWSFLTSFKPNAHINYFLEVPSAMNVKVSSTSGDVEVLRVGGDVRVYGTSGNVSLGDIGGSVYGELSSGDLEASNVGGGVRVRAASGSISLADIGDLVNLRVTRGDVEASRIGGSVEVSIVSGDLFLEGCGGDAEVVSSSGDLELSEIEGDVRATSSSGDIDLVISPDRKRKYHLSTSSGDVKVLYFTPRGYGFDLEIITGSGTIEGEMAIHVEKISRRHLKGIVGSGIARLKIETASGDVEIERAAGERR